MHEQALGPSYVVLRYHRENFFQQHGVDVVATLSSSERSILYPRLGFVRGLIHYFVSILGTC
jgi:hypothetical protein